MSSSLPVHEISGWDTVHECKRDDEDMERVDKEQLVRQEGEEEQ